MKHLRLVALLALACAWPALAAVTLTDGPFLLYRSGRVQPSATAPALYATYTECRTALVVRAAAEAKTSGILTWACRQNVVARYSPCDPKPDVESRPGVCPAGTVGEWTQMLAYVSAPAPSCWVAGPWSPADPPPDACRPIDSDGDGVPDSVDLCPTVYAETPDGCPATPPPPVNQAPTISGSPPATGTVGQVYTFTPTASDADGDPLTFAVENRPPWSGWTFDTATGRMSGTPTVVRTHPAIRIVVSDGRGGSGVLAIPTINVTAPTPLPDTQPPAAPATITATGTSSTQITVDWGPAPDNVATVGCVGQACAGACANFTELWRAGGNRQYVHTVPAGSTWRYRVACYDAAGNTGAFSPIATGATVLPPPGGTGTATLSWTTPTQNTDGSALTNLAGYRIHFGPRADQLSQTVDIMNAGLSGYVIERLSPGTWYFAVRALAASGNESALSNVATKVVQ